MGTLQNEALQKIRELVGDTPGLFGQIVKVYLESAPVLLAQLKAGLAAADFDSVRSAAHTLKSSSANLGATELSKMCSKLEAAARAGTVGTEVPSISAIEAEYEQVRTALAAELA